MHATGPVPRALAIVLIASSPALLVGPPSPIAHGVVGSWYLALDAAPFGLPPGTNLPGVATFQNSGTFQIVDGGDFGGAPFVTRQTSQMGSWRQSNLGRVQTTSLFLDADATTGQVLSWQKVELLLHPEGPDKLVGYANVFELPCAAPAPLPPEFSVFGCPDPIEFASTFEPVPPPNIPIELRRLKVR